MPLPIVDKTLFPNVPNVPGVPPLTRLNDKILFLEPANIFTSQLNRVPYLSGILQYAFADVWGIFDEDGNQILVADTLFELSQDASTKVSTFLIEEGTFSNYNKVDHSENTTIVLIKTGSPSTLSTYISEIEALKVSTDLVSIVTPERTFTSRNLESYSYNRRTIEGTNSITFRLNFIEIREVSLAFSTRTIPSASYMQDRGQQQPQDINESILSKLITGLGF